MVPQIAVVAGACVGSAALIAANADIVITVKEADYYLIQDEKDGHGGNAVVAEDVSAAMEKAVQLLSLLPSNNLASAPVYEADNDTKNCDSIENVLDGVADAEFYGLPER